MKSSTLNSNSIIINKKPLLPPGDILAVCNASCVALAPAGIVAGLELAASVGHIAEGFEDTVGDTLVYIAADTVVVAADIVALDHKVGWSLGATPPCHLLREHIWRLRNVRA